MAILKRQRAKPQAAFTLLEVILALVILGGAMAIYGEVMQLANRNAVDARAETQAQLLAESVMDQILAGAIDASQVRRQPLEVTDSTPWLYSIAIGTTDHEGVTPVEVIVEQDLEAKLSPVKFRLMRWLSDIAETDENAEEQETGGAT
jgi:prepilin-type N-terminal cleavage/methylation domain-containing protein